jgi:hypothetical protein
MTTAPITSIRPTHPSSIYPFHVFLSSNFIFFNKGILATTASIHVQKGTRPIPGTTSPIHMKRKAVLGMIGFPNRHQFVTGQSLELRYNFGCRDLSTNVQVVLFGWVVHDKTNIVGEYIRYNGVVW